jgi:hypothetical protein
MIQFQQPAPLNENPIDCCLYCRRKSTARTGKLYGRSSAIWSRWRTGLTTGRRATGVVLRRRLISATRHGRSSVRTSRRRATSRWWWSPVWLWLLGRRCGRRTCRHSHSRHRQWPSGGGCSGGGGCSRQHVAYAGGSRRIWPLWKLCDRGEEYGIDGSDVIWRCFHRFCNFIHSIYSGGSIETCELLPRCFVQHRHEFVLFRVPELLKTQCCCRMDVFCERREGLEFVDAYPPLHLLDPVMFGHCMKRRRGSHPCSGWSSGGDGGRHGSWNVSAYERRMIGLLLLMLWWWLHERRRRARRVG